jgi:hypothetical protein
MTSLDSSIRVDFQRDVLPRLQSLPVRVVAAAMDASISRVRAGAQNPHPRHWGSLAAMLGGGEHP